MISIKVNGDARSVETGTTIASLLEQMKLNPHNVAVELNKRLVRSEKYQTELSEADQIEIVTFVGGGC